MVAHRALPPQQHALHFRRVASREEEHLRETRRLVGQSDHRRHRIHHPAQQAHLRPQGEERRQAGLHAGCGLLHRGSRVGQTLRLATQPLATRHLRGPLSQLADDPESALWLDRALRHALLHLLRGVRPSRRDHRVYPGGGSPRDGFGRMDRSHHSVFPRLHHRHFPQSPRRAPDGNVAPAHRFMG